MFEGCVYGQLTLWRFDFQKKNLRMVASYQDHLERVNDIIFSHELKIMISCSSDGRINIYNTHNQKYLRSIFHDNPINLVNIISLQIIKINLANIPLCCVAYYSNTEKIIYCKSINGQLLSKYNISKDIITPLYITKHHNFDEVLVTSKTKQKFNI